MHRCLAVFLLPFLLAVPTAMGHDIGNPSYVNFLLDGFTTPDLAPGESGELRFAFTNTYPWNMVNVTLRLEFYRYVEVDRKIEVNALWPYSRPSFFDASGDHRLRWERQLPDPPQTSLAPDESLNLTVTILTDEAMPHGSLTKQGAYFIRTWLEFELTDGVTTNVSVMASKGWFTDEQWATARGACNPATSYCVGILNMSYLGSVLPSPRDHLDGLLPDTSFSALEHMPLWPFVVVGGVMVVSFVFAVLFYAEENPGKYPRLARWWLGVKGKARTARPPRSR